ncbi:MAG TPA: hypothetical protein VHO25_10125 [Polyangiaceae bacterium]|nr:hypothetical protein [Polyangiaceae bacterium]
MGEMVMKLGCLLLGGPQYGIEIGGESYSFEMHPQLGPLPKADLGHKHEFWRAASLWVKQGERVENGIAIWEEPREVPTFTLREIKLCACGEQMYREKAAEPWTCLPCELRKRVHV